MKIKDALLTSARYLHPEPPEACEWWLNALISPCSSENERDQFKRRLTSSIEFSLGHKQRSMECATKRIDDHALAMYISDRLRQADMHSYALDILLDSLRRSSNKLTVLERIGYIISQIQRLKLNPEHSSEVYSTNQLDQWSSRLLNEFEYDKSCCLALGNASHLMASHDVYGSGYLLNQMILASTDRVNQHRYNQSSMLFLPGPGKTGTTSLFDYIQKRYLLTSYQGKEIDYWDIFIKHGLPVEWYLNHFYTDGNPTLAIQSAIDCSPSSFGCIQSLAKEISYIKDKLDLFCLLTLRDPISRAISMLSHEHRTSMQELGLIDYAQITLDRVKSGEDISSSALYQSRYELFAPKWIELVGSAQSLSIFMESMTAENIDSMMHFWGYKAHIPASIASANTNPESSRLLSELRDQDQLMSVFKSYFEETYEWIAQEKVRVSEVIS
jgi:hypothetical protein